MEKNPEVCISLNRTFQLPSLCWHCMLLWLADIYTNRISPWLAFWQFGQLLHIWISHGMLASHWNLISCKVIQWTNVVVPACAFIKYKKVKLKFTSQFTAILQIKLFIPIYCLTPE
jgi:hypothetical protein